MRSLLVVMLTLLLVSPVSYALTLEEARAQGRVGETLSGYLAPVAQDAETATLVARINQARAASYREVAQQNGLPVDAVAKMAGQKLVARSKPGEYVRGINGRWMKK
ncbi:YdbL family protein [Cronobacter turicensis]|nr:YdbL family protein [Cronobacter turicensis]ELY4129339.1 YdbL family protein [Cronobacter turicensis]ELY4348978.1 YdbL family protein [Cronobacter turicensis]ELY6277466.1 YdbL family protein [Cronobacter turicensis]